MSLAVITPLRRLVRDLAVACPARGDRDLHAGAVLLPSEDRAWFSGLVTAGAFVGAFVVAAFALRPLAARARA